MQIKYNKNNCNIVAKINMKEYLDCVVIPYYL